MLYTSLLVEIRALELVSLLAEIQSIGIGLLLLNPILWLVAYDSRPHFQQHWHMYTLPQMRTFETLQDPVQISHHL